jgi:hypothetical protein
MPGNQSRKIWRTLLSLLAAMGMLLVYSPAGRCQDMPKSEASTSYTYMRGYAAHNGGTFDMAGGSASLSINVKPWLGLVQDYGGYYFTGVGYGLNSTMYSYLFGPRFSLRRSSRRWTPFGQCLVGVTHINVRGSSLSVHETTAALDTGGGMDFAVTRHFSVRVAQVDYLWTQFGTETGRPAVQNNFRFSAGLVLRIGTNINSLR